MDNCLSDQYGGHTLHKYTSTRLLLFNLATLLVRGLWVLFKDKLSPVQEMLSNLFNTVKKQIPNSINVIVPDIPESFPSKTIVKTEETGDVFFDLVVSWKQTRDLAVKSGCSKAVEVADQMFPYLSPTICENGDSDE